ncbi:HD-like signal output (HDOD) protein [Thiogranum longum]|uniref:HD-like signal output (HDOD) protein n=1 Tax=Thiogranum longum TaxID=1537524 RepID=A0A4R1HAQ1_9GAMM|nr:HDOD domain-containing protein [Thiogranum longum]TCK18418.1 HD-like signal output (HDOD) protein [Thiogranum longum]
MDASTDVMDVLRLLLDLRDLDEMGDVALLDLARDARVETLGGGQLLHADEHLDRHVYLLEGEVDLIADGKTMQTVTAGNERALLPVFRIHTRGLVARCTRPARLMVLNQATFDHYAATLRPDRGACTGITVEEYTSSDALPGLIDEIRQAFYHQEVDLPSMPDMALKISRAVQSPDADFRQIATTVQADPVIAARIVQVANSAMYAGVSRVESVQNAITRIGLQTTRVIVMTVVLKNLYTPQTRLIHDRMKAYYLHSIRIGAICHALAAHLPGFDPEQAFLAGLMHNIGVLPLLIQADRRSDLNHDPDVLEQVIQELAWPVGALLLEQWAFEPPFITAAREATNWDRDVEEADYCDIVQVAQLHAVLVGGKRVDAPPLVELPAFNRLPMGEVDPVKLVEAAREEIGEITGMLAG